MKHDPVRSPCDRTGPPHFASAAFWAATMTKLPWYCVGLALVLLGAGAGLGQAPPVQPAAVAKIERLPLPADAHALALTDLRTLPPGDQPFIRYLWVRDGLDETAQALSLAVNQLSRANTIIRPVPLRAGKVLLQRLDLRHYAPRAPDLAAWLQLWEDFQLDPVFSLLLTRDSLKFVLLRFPDWKGRGYLAGTRRQLVDCEPYTHPEDGRVYRRRWEAQRVRGVQTLLLQELQDVELIRLPSSQLDLAAYGELAQRTASEAPVVSHGYFVYRTLSAIEDQGLYALLYGGRYYQFAGIRKGAKQGTDEDALLEDLGVGSVKDGLTARQLFERLRSDQRAAIFRSGVTGRPRQMEFFRTLAGRVDQGSGLISITHDLRDQDIDVGTHPIANLLAFKDFAREVIFQRPNNLHGYALFNAAGKLQVEVPPDVAKDHTIPAPFTAKLQPAISCISCHEAEGSDGWKPVANSVQALVGIKTKADIFGDLTQLDKTIPDTIDRLAGLYGGDPEKALQRGREEYSAAVLRATGPFRESAKGQTDVVKLAGGRLVKIWRNYWYDLVSPQHALEELGVRVVEPRDAQAVLGYLLQPVPETAVPVPAAGVIILPEDFRALALKAGLSINRSDWDLVREFAAYRVTRSLTALAKEKAK